MVQSLFVRVCLCVGFADTFCNDLSIAVPVASILAIFALHSSGVFEKFAAKRAAHYAVELLCNKFMAILLHYFLFALAHSSFSVQAQVKSSLALIMLVYRCG